MTMSIAYGAAAHSGFDADWAQPAEKGILSAMKELADLSSFLVQRYGVCAFRPGSTSATGPLAALYSVADGQGTTGALFEHFEFLSREDAEAEKTMMDQLARDDDWPVEWWDPAWFPFASDRSGQLLVVHAATGHVVEFVHDDPDRPVLATSLPAFFAGLRAKLEAGLLVYDVNLGLVSPAALAADTARRAKLNPPAPATGAGLTSGHDELAVLVRERGEELSPSMKAVVATTRAWLGVFGVGGVIGAFALGALACVSMYRLFDGAQFVLVVVQMPLTIGTVVVVRAVRRRAARALARRLERELRGVGGSTSAAVSVHPTRNGS
ncbi:MAG: SMI1/KNR4 family protein [Deltaproteobacteria bacterium]|nr:SMI1/KNR4 family protein [Deltaproteobacteria bacterium]